jgi:hypothetical protein
MTHTCENQHTNPSCWKHLLVTAWSDKNHPHICQLHFWMYINFNSFIQIKYDNLEILVHLVSVLQVDITKKFCIWQQPYKTYTFSLNNYTTAKEITWLLKSLEIWISAQYTVMPHHYQLQYKTQLKCTCTNNLKVSLHSHMHEIQFSIWMTLVEI